MLVESLLGGLLGSLARLAPEVIKFFNSKEDNKHELEMFKLQIESDKLKGEFKVEEKYVDYSIHQLSAMSEAYKEQAAAVSKGSKWVANLSASVRPGIAWFVFLLYALSKVAFIVTGIVTGQPWLSVLGAWGPEDNALLMMILSFYYTQRAIEKYRQ